MVIKKKMATVCIFLVCSVIQLTAASVENVAVGKPVSISSSKSGYRASTAVDGNTDVGGYTPQYIIDTGYGYPFAWWKVDLEREVQDATVRIYFRVDYTWRRNGVKLYTSTSPFNESNSKSQGQLCHTVTGDPSGSDIPDVYSVTCPGRWRYLLLYTDTDNMNNGRSTGPILDFGEVEVMECSDGTYGDDCTKTCSSRNCVTMTTTCDRDGRCPDGCQSGWTGVDCTQALPPCNNSYYGLNCDKLCSDRKCKAPSTSSCDRLTGRCPDGCEAGWREEDCTQACETSNYGRSCALLCTDRQCLDALSPCDHVTGQCVGGCPAGYKGVDCTQTCSPGVTYGVGCEKSCSSRHCMTSSTGCDLRTGQCPGGCESGWTGVDCATACPIGTFGFNCTERCGECDGVCDSVSGLCYVGCLEGYSGAWCNVTRTTETNNNNNNNIVGAVVGSVLGTFLVVVLVCVGVHVLLIRQGRLKWVKSPEGREPVQRSREMSNVATQQANVHEHAHPSSHVIPENYAVLDPEQMRGNKDYDVIEHKEYQNT